jgi:hypothetical protein
MEIQQATGVAVGLASTDARLSGSVRRIRQDLRAEGYALIADKHTLRQCRIAASAFNEASHFMLRLTTKRAEDMVMLDGAGHLVSPLSKWVWPT